MTPQTVNAVDLPLQNALNFPAAILQPPFFDPLAPAAANYGAIGTIIGHEISHTFDTEGSVFDSKSNVRNWWTPSDLAHFEAASLPSTRRIPRKFEDNRRRRRDGRRVHLLMLSLDATGVKRIPPYDNYKPFPDLSINGKQTLAENIADIAGISAAYDGYRTSLAGKSAPEQDGFSGDQQFFIAFGQNYASKIRDAALRQQVMTDSHSPAEHRADTVRNINAWYAGFEVKPGEKLYLAPPDRVRIW